MRGAGVRARRVTTALAGLAENVEELLNKHFAVVIPASGDWFW
tara:strand:- start:384 stop:512 length:129 start_codon:yes stop_codon:yes gene_type:complete